jgi:oligopeptide transport system substrate-binding protein
MKFWIIRLGLLAALVAGLMAFHQSRQHRESRVSVAGKNKILLVGNGTEIETLDPHQCNGMPEHHVIGAIFEGLVAPAANDPDADAAGAAASWEQKDFTVWTFHLQPKGKWSDGMPVTAHDFAYAYQRILSPELAADYGQMLYLLVNGEDYNLGKLKDFSKVGVKVIDDLTLQLTLTGPTPFFPGMLKHYAWFPLPRHVIEKFGGMTKRDTLWFKPGNSVSNGPFKLKAWHFTHYLEVDRNPHYWDAATVKLNEVHFFPISSDATEERAFQDGQLHVTEIVPLNRIPYYRSRPDVYREVPSLATYFYRVNTTKPPFNDKRVRRALALAIDQESIIRNILRAGQKPATGLTPASCAPDYKTPKSVTFQPDEARRLLAEAGYPDGKGFPKFDILINTNEAHRTIAEAIQEMWKNILHIPAGILNQDWQVYLDSQRKMEYSLCRAGWVGDYADPLTFLGTMRSTDGNNNTGWKSERYDQLLNQSSTEPDAKKRFAILQEAETLMLDDMPVLPVYWYVRYYLVRPEVKNWQQSVMEHRCYKALDL